MTNWNEGAPGQDNGEPELTGAALKQARQDLEGLHKEINELEKLRENVMRERHTKESKVASKFANERDTPEFTEAFRAAGASLTQDEEKAFVDKMHLVEKAEALERRIALSVARGAK